MGISVTDFRGVCSLNSRLCGKSLSLCCSRRYRLFVPFGKLRERIPKCGNRNDKMCDSDKFELFDLSNIFNFGGWGLKVIYECPH